MLPGVCVEILCEIDPPSVSGSGQIPTLVKWCSLPTAMQLEGDMGLPLHYMAISA